MVFLLSTENTIFLCVLCFLLLILFVTLNILFRKKLGKFPYVAKESILSKSEFDFYRQLKESLVETDFIILMKVGIRDIVRIPRDAKKYIAWLNKIDKKHVDFLICDKSLKPIRVIELDDRTHNLPGRIERDKFVDEIFESVSIPIEHIKVESSYNLDYLKSSLVTHIETGQKSYGSTEK